MKERTVTLGGKTYDIKNPLNVQEAMWLLQAHFEGMLMLETDSESVQYELTVGLEALSRIQVSLVTEVLLDSRTGKSFDEEDVYDSQKMPPDEVSNVLFNVLPNLPEVDVLLKEHKKFRQNARINPPQDASQGLVPMLESVPEVVQIGGQSHRLMPFSFGMQTIATRLLNMQRNAAKRRDPRGETNPALLLFNALMTGVGDTSLFIRALLPRAEGGMVDVTEVHTLAGVDVYMALLTAIASPSLQSFLLTQPWKHNAKASRKPSTPKPKTPQTNTQLPVKASN